MKSLYRIANIKHGWSGLREVWREEWQFKYQVGFVAIALTVSILLEVSPLEFFLLFATLCMAIGSEIINTLIENICDRIEPNYDSRIGTVKNIAAGFVIVASLPAVVMIAWILYSNLF